MKIFYFLYDFMEILHILEYVILKKIYTHTHTHEEQLDLILYPSGYTSGVYEIYIHINYIQCI